MLKKLLPAAILAFLCWYDGSACTNVIVTPGASSDSSSMVSYAADSHWLYGELYSSPARRFGKGAVRSVTEWDSFMPLGEIPQVARTYRTMGNMNERQLIIGETTWGGREELMDPDGKIDYGSLIYIALERSSSAREAIKIIVQLANACGYHSEGESFSIADPSEAWVMDIIGKGEGNKGIVWVARRIPDGYICAHANQCRITRFPLDDPENCLYAPDVISFAREKGWFSGKDSEFSFREAYCPLDMGTVRGCDARVWSAFNTLCDGEFRYEQDGETICRPAGDWLRYAMGGDLGGEMPLFVKPARKLSVKDIADIMRDHFEGTPMDMTLDIGAGGNACPYRWRPMDFEWGGHTYLNERAIATQQTGFWFVGQARGSYPDELGALLWFGCDDAATSYLTPIYVSSSKVPECLRPGNGDLLHYSATSQFWICNRVAQACYKMYNLMAPVARAAADSFENRMIGEAVPEIDAKVDRILKGHGPFRKFRARRALTRFSVRTAMDQFAAWVKLEELLLVKFIDGNVKAQNEDGSFAASQYDAGTPEGLTQPGYTDVWKRAVASDPHSETIREK